MSKITQLTCLACVLAVGPLTAQEATWSARTGVFLPSGDALDSAEIYIGLETELPAARVIPGIGGFLSLTADWTSITHSVDDKRRDTAVFPIMINWKQRPIDPERRTWDYGVGMGVYWALEDIPDMSFNDGPQFAWQAMVGYRFSPPWSAEVRFMSGTRPRDDSLVGLGIQSTF